MIEGLEAHYDMIVVGGGAIGCSVAFWLMQRVIEGFKILVVERDPQVLTFVICTVLNLIQISENENSIQISIKTSHTT